MAVYTAASIKEKLKTDDRWLIRGLLAIYACQTASEQASGQTDEHNGIGFNGVDAYILTSFAEQAKAGRRLSSKQIMIARKKMLKYAGQLSRIAKSKESENNC
jgi:hypothetical protein